ncbi:MAG: imidazoleglycerol-phosphate dehydratase HisB [Solirubrobacteraceae bacterium]|nr:imidazoleglycerol-phosphate dehydratase HisB [Solirubrobacteraceae bacterium]
MARTAEITRTTGETDIRLSVDLDGSGAGTRSTGVGFFDHMLELFARHGLIDLEVTTKGDTETGSHHTVEDTGIVLGQAIAEALGDRSGITRYGSAIIPMDETLARCALDFSGRPFAAVNAPQLVHGVTGGFEHELLEEFVRAFANGARATVHVDILAGTNAHHIIEGAFKALARAVRQAVAIDPRERGIPSTKGSL